MRIKSNRTPKLIVIQCTNSGREFYDAEATAYHEGVPGHHFQISLAQELQALGYKIGQLKIIELRERARSELGSKFDIRAFHDQLLGNGALPLDILERLSGVNYFFR